MNNAPGWGLFDVFGVELEYMIVNEQLNVSPITDRILHRVAGAYEAEVERGELAWSNELALHVIELKTNGPAAQLAGLATAFHAHVLQINEILAEWQARLMPTAMHPWMDPDLEMRLWPHGYSAVYESFDRIFDCRGHGWANLQSVHLNLPFQGDEEFAALHAAIRVVLPLLPALAASSPLVLGQRSAFADTRLEFYRHNARRLPRISGRVVPEPVYSQQAYEQEILEPIYQDIAPFDSQGVLQHEWLNARGAIARFERNTIEVRVLDVQECPAADLAICQLVVAALKALISNRWESAAERQAIPTDPLVRILDATIRDAELAAIDDAAYLRLWGADPHRTWTAHELWNHIAATTRAADSLDAACRPAFNTLLKEGTLANRIVSRVGTQPSREQLALTYQELCECLQRNESFHA